MRWIRLPPLLEGIKWGKICVHYCMLCVCLTLPADSDSIRPPFISLWSSGRSYGEISMDTDTSERERCGSTWRKCLPPCTFYSSRRDLIMCSPLSSASHIGGCSSNFSGATFRWQPMLKKAAGFSWLRFIVSTITGNSRDYREENDQY